MRTRFLALAFLLCIPLMGQSVQLSRVTLSGFVRNAHGRPVPNAFVRFKSNAATRLVKSDKSGHYIVFSMPQGTYNVIAYARGKRNCWGAPQIATVSGFRYHYDVRVHWCRRR